MPQSQEPGESAPLRNPNNRSNRRYIGAVWQDSAGGTRSTKVSGGVELQKGTLKEAPRGLNRPSQLYSLPASEMITRRTTRAIDEYNDTIVLINRTGIYEVRTVSGKSIDVATGPDFGWINNLGEKVICQCEDEWKLRKSGYQFNVVCKHVTIVNSALIDPARDPLGYGTEYVARVTGFDQDTIETLCRHGILTADLVRHTWIIDADSIAGVIAILEARKVDMPPLGEV